VVIHSNKYASPLPTAEGTIKYCFGKVLSTTIQLLLLTGTLSSNTCEKNDSSFDPDFLYSACKFSRVVVVLIYICSELAHIKFL
jgi:hypothetical protein